MKKKPIHAILGALLAITLLIAYRQYRKTSALIEHDDSAPASTPSTDSATADAFASTPVSAQNDIRSAPLRQATGVAEKTLKEKGYTVINSAVLGDSSVIFANKDGSPPITVAIQPKADATDPAKHTLHASVSTPEGAPQDETTSLRAAIQSAVSAHR